MCNGCSAFIAISLCRCAAAPGQIALKGVNLTALAPEPFAAKYVARIIRDEMRKDRSAAQARLLPLILSEAAQNAMHLTFNAGLAAMAAQEGLTYFDLVQDTATHDSATPRLADAYRPAEFDHHLVDSVAVRKMHYLAAGAAFGLTAPMRKPSRKSAQKGVRKPPRTPNPGGGAGAP